MLRISGQSARSIRTSPRGRRWNVCALLMASVYLTVHGSVFAAAQSAPDKAASLQPPAEIIQRMVQQNELRSEHLKYFTSRRHYHVEFHGLGRTIAADMDVQTTYHAGSGKSFQIIDESGSRLLINHVLKKLLETEQDDSRQQKASLTLSNYDFAFQGETSERGRSLYVFAVKPKVKNKLLYRGTIWIDARDYAVVRVAAQPAESPSFWIKKTEIQHVYAKSGEFWLPETNKSESQVRLGGSAVLTINYGTYQFEEPHGLISAEEITRRTSAEIEPLAMQSIVCRWGMQRRPDPISWRDCSSRVGQLASIW